jgi:hypothetical protein
MDMGAFITAAATGFTAVATVLIAWFVKRTDRAAKLTQANMHDQEYILKLVGALREDYWAIMDWSYSARSRFMMLLGLVDKDVLPEHLAGLDPIPSPKHRDLESSRINLSTEDGK